MASARLDKRQSKSRLESVSVSPSLSPRLRPFLPFLYPDPGPLAIAAPGLRAPELGSPRTLQEA